MPHKGYEGKSTDFPQFLADWPDFIFLTETMGSPATGSAKAQQLLL
jgi:hypothetical protein